VQILGLITRQLTTRANAHDRDTLRRNRKAIAALLPYAVWQEQYRQNPMLFNAFLRAANPLSLGKLPWNHILPFMKTLLSDTSDIPLTRAAMFALPYVFWHREDSRDLVQAWVATASAIPKEKEIAPSVVDALLQIAYYKLLPPGNHGDVWSWLTLRPSLPPICEGRRWGSHPHVIQQVRGLKDIEILKSYLLVVWSEWDTPFDLSFDLFFDPFFGVLREEFSGVEASSHRAELVQRLDDVIGELDKGLAYLQRDRPDLEEDELQYTKGQYEKLRKILMEIPEAPEIPACMSSRLINLFDLLTLVDTHRISLNIRMCAPYAVSAVGCLQCSVLIPLPYTYHLSVRTPPPSFIAVRFPFTLLITPKLLLRLQVVKRAGLFSCLWTGIYP